jgi:hypothetical protein|tara:strand:+ start:333 stop:515 length:183 start_codon:yes stop_codon:yes gene_type:complete
MRNTDSNKITFINKNNVKCSYIKDELKLIPIHLYLIDKGLSDEEIGDLTLDELEEMLDNE